MRLRIALVSREFPPDHGGGIGSYAARIVPALALAGATVHIITRRLAAGETEVQVPPGVVLHRVEMGDRSGESCLRASIVVAQKLLELTSQQGLDAIEFAEYEAMGSAWLALRSLDDVAASVPVAMHLHSPTELNAELNGHDAANLDRAMHGLIEAERRCIDLADGVCAPGSFMADWAKDRFAMANRPAVIPYAMSDTPVPAMSSDSHTLLYVGRLEQRKGVDTLIRAWNRVGTEHQAWTLRLVGTDTNTAPGGGSCRVWLESLLDHAVRTRTDFTGPMDADSLREARSHAAIAVIPSCWENFPNTCIEAMADGLPVVASDRGGMAEMLGLPTMSGAADDSCGSVFPAGDSAALAEALGRWMSRDPEYRVQAGRDARERIVDLCNPEAVAQKRIEWMSSLQPRTHGVDDSLRKLLRAGEVHSTDRLEDALQRTLDCFDQETRADRRTGDAAGWAEQMRRVLLDCAAQGLTPVALYGAGHFTRSIGAALRQSPVEIACIIDDDPASHGGRLHGLPIVSQAQAIKRGVRAAVLSANQWEDSLWESSAALRAQGIRVLRLFGKKQPRVMVVESGTDTHHFAGLTEELVRRGVEVIGDTPRSVYPVPDEDLDLVCVADVLAPRNIAILRAARAKGIRTLLMMDGVVEWRNTFINPLAGPDFLRPAPVDFICCATIDDERHLREFGNEATATGLPRLDGLTSLQRDPSGPILIATANTPWFNANERDLLTGAIRNLCEVAQRRGIPVRWRLTGGLDRALGIENHAGSLREAMSDCRAVVSTPSTLLLEAAIVGLPIAVLDPFGQPVLSGMDGIVRSERAEDLLAGVLAGTDSADTWLKRAYPARANGRRASSLLADRIAAIAHQPGQSRVSAPLLDTVKLTEELPLGVRPRAVSVIVCDGSPTSGVTTFSLRMSAESAARQSGWEWHTLLVQTRPHNAANDGLRELEPEHLGHVHVCVLDPTDDHHKTLRSCREAVERLNPQVLVPNFSDMTWAVAAQLRHQGVRALGIMHSDDQAYRDLLRERPVWDSGVAVSAECAEQMRSIASEVFDDHPPIEQITYGVPIAEQLTDRAPDGPLKLLYVGRLIEHQKRVSRLVELATHLQSLGCEFRLDLIGDGPSEGSLRSALREGGLEGAVRLRGRLTPSEVQTELESTDCLVLVSDFEGTSIAMLEAMGQGVVPCVSRVASGVDEWIADGVHGVTAPVGDVRQLAEKIATLARDRFALNHMSRCAWKTASERGSIPVMFDRYERVLHEVMQRPISPQRNALGLLLSEGGRWVKPWCDDPDGAKRYAKAVLEEAGYRLVADGAPTPGCDAVLADVLSSPHAVCRADSWRDQGLAVACLPCIIRPGWMRFGGVLREVADTGASRIALYGAGQHTQRVLPVLRGHLPIVGIIDDHAAGSAVCGLPVVAPGDASALRPDAVVLSSDSVEELLWHAARPLREAGIPVYAVYGAYEDSPSPSASPIC